MIFLTVGTQFPFDRLVRAVDEAVQQKLIDEEIFAQIGETSYRPRSFEAVFSLEKQEFDRRMSGATKIVSHAGMGTITAGLENNKPMLVMPRLKRFGEVVNDHQLEIARRFERDGHLLAAYEVGELPEKLRALRTFVPAGRRVRVEDVAARVSMFLCELSSKG